LNFKKSRVSTSKVETRLKLIAIESLI